MSEPVLSVSDLVLSIKRLLESEYRDITVEGEISNLSLSSAGHYYFNLSDADTSVSCALFKMDAFRNPMIRKLKDGDKVIVRGPISLYAKRGTFQVICKRITPAGKGDLKAQFEKLKEKLRREGLFDQDKKHEIPALPKKIAIITAKHGAALQDFLNVMKRRSFWYDIVIIPSAVQGDHAPKELRQALKRASEMNDIDVIVLTRGGGSLEDLWAFNDEGLTRDIAECSIPIISAVGHQVDFSLSDFVADLRCETPTAAAELLSQSQTLLSSRMNLCARSLKNRFLEFKIDLQTRLGKINPRRTSLVLQNKIAKYKTRLEQTTLSHRDHLVGIPSMYMRIDESIEKMQRLVERKLEKNSTRLHYSEKLLQNLNPNNVLSRGYAIVEDENRKVVSSLKEFDKIALDSKLTIKFSDGKGQVRKEK